MAFVGVNHRDTFVPHGTAFIVISFPFGRDSLGFQTVVTARHVISRIAGETVHLRLNTRDGQSSIVETSKGVWHPHPDRRIDVSVCSHPMIDNTKFDIGFCSIDRDDILTEEAIAQHNIGVGDEVAVIGLYVARMGEKKNIPIVRIGTIAAMPEEKIQTEFGSHDAYLVEVRSIDGLSGSPVYLRGSPWRENNGQLQWASGKTHYLMGMMLGYNEVKNPADAIEILPTAPRPASDGVQEIVTGLNTGIAIVLPIADVCAAIEQPAIREVWDRANAQFLESKAARS